MLGLARGSLARIEIAAVNEPADAHSTCRHCWAPTSGVIALAPSKMTRWSASKTRSCSSSVLATWLVRRQWGQHSKPCAMPQANVCRTFTTSAAFAALPSHSLQPNQPAFRSAGDEICVPETLRVIDHRDDRWRHAEYLDILWHRHRKQRIL